MLESRADHPFGSSTDPDPIFPGNNIIQVKISRDVLNSLIKTLRYKSSNIFREFRKPRPRK